jgi:oligopeptide/dipeptide ABC transporter ATP-binding protein
LATDKTAPSILLEASDLMHEFATTRLAPARSRTFRALAGVSLRIATGETLGLLGESGSGKTTLVRALMQAPPPTRGSVVFLGQELTALKGRRLVDSRRQMQLIFQDAFSSLNPKLRVSQIVEEPLIGYGIGNHTERRQKVAEVLELVGLPLAVYGNRRPRELSGGQCQRVAIARALTLEPALLLCDEAVSSLDVVIQAQILNLFERLRSQLHLSYLFVSHDLAVLRQVSDRLAVLYRGRIVEMGSADAIYREPQHPYTQCIMAFNSQRPGASTTGELSARKPEQSATSSLRGCAFLAHCQRAIERCAIEDPQLKSVGNDHVSACHLVNAL